MLTYVDHLFLRSWEWKMHRFIEVIQDGSLFTLKTTWRWFQLDLCWMIQAKLLFGGDQKKNTLIKQFLRDVAWSELDFLVVDTPPGTSDEHLSIVKYLQESKPDGAIIITTPQEVSLLDVRKEINFCRKVGVPILGVVENMSGFVCPKCNTETPIFFPSTGGAEAMCKEMNLELLGKIPLDPMIARSCDEGKSYITQFPNSKASQEYQSIVTKLLRIVTKSEK